MSKDPYGDSYRIFITLVIAAVVLVVTQFIFLVFKVFGVLGWSWWIVVCPLGMPLLLVACLLLFLVVLDKINGVK